MLNDPAIYTRCSTYSAYMYFFMGQISETERRVESLVAALPDIDDPYQAASIARLQGYLMASKGHLEPAYRCFEQGLSLMRPTLSSHGVCRLLNDLGELSLKMLRLDEARRHLDEALTIARATNDVVETARVYRHLACLARLCGHLDDGIGYCGESLAAAEESGWNEEIANTKAELAQLYNLKGDAEIARQLLQDAFATYDRLGDEAAVARVRSLLISWSAANIP
jgi:tetratricopeptide (TPR) repeat protein